MVSSNGEIQAMSEDALDNPDIGQTDLNSELLFEEDPEQDTTIFFQKITMIIVRTVLNRKGKGKMLLEQIRTRYSNIWMVKPARKLMTQNK